MRRGPTWKAAISFSLIASAVPVVTNSPMPPPRRGSLLQLGCGRLLPPSHHRPGQPPEPAELAELQDQPDAADGKCRPLPLAALEQLLQALSPIGRNHLDDGAHRLLEGLLCDGLLELAVPALVADAVDHEPEDAAADAAADGEPDQALGPDRGRGQALGQLRHVLLQAVAGLLDLVQR